MGQKKKRNHPDVEEVLARPWCYYCERDFDDLKILISHQKAKHFKCERCGRRLNTAGGLSVHMNQVHKENLLQVENALPNRAGLEVEIFGMEGIPEDVVQAHNARLLQQFYAADAERRGVSGNQGGAGNQGGLAKKPRFESPADLKKRLAEHKARKAEQVANGNSGANTPSMVNSPLAQSPGQYAGSPYVPPPTPYTGPPASGYGSFSQEPYPSPAITYPQTFSAQPSFSGPPGSQFPPQFSPPQQYPQVGLPGYQQPSFQTPNYGAGSPPGSFSTYQPPPTHTPPNHSGLPNRPPSLPPVPGLPQRPSFAAPPVPTYQMHQMHPNGPSGWNGSWNGQDQNPAMSSAYPTQSHGDPTNASLDNGQEVGDDIDKLIRMAEAGIKPPKKDVPAPAATEAVATPESSEKPAAAEKKSRKDRPMKMIYSDNEVSPEEKMAMLPRYAFIPEGKAESGSSIEAVA